jgi:hypothetical protein
MGNRGGGTDGGRGGGMGDRGGGTDDRGGGTDGGRGGGMGDRGGGTDGGKGGASSIFARAPSAIQSRRRRGGTRSCRGHVVFGLVYYIIKQYARLS